MTKRHKNTDPHAKREASKYAQPIPSREYIMQKLETAGVPMTISEIAEAISVNNSHDQESLRRRLRAMERDAQLMRNRRGGYCLLDKMDMERGSIIAHPDGFGFLVPEHGGKDLFISAKEMRAVLHGDHVVARVVGEDRRGRLQGAIVEVVQRNTTRVVGRYRQKKGAGFVIPDNKRINMDILISSEQAYGASDGQIVMVEILEFPTKYRQSVGRVIEILGDHMDPGMEIDIAIRSYGLREEWSPLVEAEIENLNIHVPESAKQGRKDIRELPLVTIDGEDARDFDDAVYCEVERQGWRLIVAIADVSAYVNPGTALDAEARERATSVYFPERVIPMLPEVLSNGLCSLNPDVDRLCMVCDMQISTQGETRSVEFYPAVMRSHARLTYNKVAAMLVDNELTLTQQYQAILPHLQNLYDLYKVLRHSRSHRGAIDFESSDTRIVFAEDKKIERIIQVQSNDAHKLIEECMLAANVAAAGFLRKHKIPALFRNHEGPAEDKLNDLRTFLKELGLHLTGGNDPQPADYAQLLESINDRVDRHMIQTVMLRSLSQAVYDNKNLGHFGLAYDSYAHFTSPIRRYPDLMVHRAIKHIYHKKAVEHYYLAADKMHELGVHCSSAERRADEATWDAIDWLKCEYMQDRVGDEFSGIVTGVTGFGLFVELEDIYVEGLVHVSALDNDYYHFDAVHHRMIGERTNTIYQLGHKIKIRVMRVDLDERQIDFEIAGKKSTLDIKKSSKAGRKSTKSKKAATNKKSRRAKSRRKPRAKS